MGGPHHKNKAFFFVNYEQYLLPGTKSYTRTILNQDAMNGIFSYCPTGTSNAACASDASLLKKINVYSLAAARRLHQYARPDAAEDLPGHVCDDWRRHGDSARRQQQRFQPGRFELPAHRKPAARFRHSRLDYNLTSNHHLSFVYNYDKYTSIPDFLNNVVAAFPGTGVALGSTVQTGQNSNRFAGTLSLRSQFGSHVTNEWRGGLNGGTVLFFPDVSPGLYSTWRGYRPLFGSSTYVSGVSTATSSQRRNAPGEGHRGQRIGHEGLAPLFVRRRVHAGQLLAADRQHGHHADHYVCGGHRRPGSEQRLHRGQLCRFPPPRISRTRPALYSILTGRVSSISKQLVLDEKTKQYSATPTVDRNRQREYGGYVQDTWRAARNLTINLGLRYEKQGQYENLNGLYSRVGYQSLWGLSGVGNLF